MQFCTILYYLNLQSILNVVEQQLLFFGNVTKKYDISFCHQFPILNITVYISLIIIKHGKYSNSVCPIFTLSDYFHD